MSIKLDAALLKKISSMTLRARYIAEGFISGLHQSHLRGASLEFVQHRQYVQGDALKYIDWKVYGRTNRLYIKQFQDETNLRGYSIIDTSLSMGYASEAPHLTLTKLEYATYLSAAITYLMIKQRDSAGLITYSDKIEEFVPPRNFKAHLQHILNKLDDLTPNSASNFTKSFQEIAGRLKKRSLLMLFSDLLEEPSDIIKSLKMFPYLKNDLIVFHILDPEEINLNSSGLIEYVDMETSRKLRTRPEIIRVQYRKKMKEFLTSIERGLRSHKIDYYLITTDMPLDTAITKFMEGRKRVLR